MLSRLVHSRCGVLLEARSRPKIDKPLQREAQRSPKCAIVRDRNQPQVRATRCTRGFAATLLSAEPRTTRIPSSWSVCSSPLRSSRLRMRAEIAEVPVINRSPRAAFQQPAALILRSSRATARERLEGWPHMSCMEIGVIYAQPVRNEFRKSVYKITAPQAAAYARPGGDNRSVPRFDIGAEIVACCPQIWHVTCLPFCNPATS